MIIGDTPIVEVLAVIFMLIYGRSKQEKLLACALVILIESITLYQNYYLDIYFNYLVIFYAYIVMLFAHLSHKSSFVSVYAYISYIAAYFLFAIEDTMMEWGAIISDSVFYGNYSVIMYGCLLILVYSVTYDRMAGIRLGANKTLFSNGSSANYHSEINL